MPSNIICDKEGYALSLGDRVRVEIKESKTQEAELWIGQIDGFNSYMSYAIRISGRNGRFGWYKRSDVRKLAARTLRIAEIKPVPFRRA